MPYTVYILKCADKTLYTGCTNNLEKRLREHNYGTAGAKYTRARRPVKLVFSKTFRTLAAGRKREAEIKRLTRREKFKLIGLSGSTWSSV
ncbi:MAG: GIY-YIG nuclease family protein [bacterium]|nr:GIY-YIG nuclease family protein [bacterium]